MRNLHSVEQEFQKVDRTDAPQGTQAIDRAAQLLTLVLDSDEPLGVGDLALAAELPKSTASRLVSSLERHGLVRRNGARGKVQAGPAILRFAHRGIVDRAKLEIELAKVREAAFATAIDELEPGLAALAAPVHGPTGDVIAALSVSGPTLRLGPDRIAELQPVLTKQAAALSARLGHREKGRRAA